MDPQCEIVGKYVLPIYRAMLAKELVQKYGLSQTATAKKLGTTQAAISQYLSSKRAYKGIEHIEEYLPKIQAMADETAGKLARKEIETDEATIVFCELCSSLCKKEKVMPQIIQPEYSI